MKSLLYTAITSLLITTGLYPDASINILPCYPVRNTVDADWLIVGAGPSGIATLGVLLDVGVPAHRITWIDPEFEVGRIGMYYQHVPANAITKQFILFINACSSFKECASESITVLNNANPDTFYELQIIINPLRDITAHLRTKVVSQKACMKSLYFSDDAWTIITDSNTAITAHNVILATGSHPTILNYEREKVLSLDVALNPHNLEHVLTAEDIVGVVGSAHSGILLLKFLSELSFPLKHIYNLYRSPIAYSNGGQADGIRGATADWAQTVLEKNPPANLTRVFSTPDTITDVLSQCTKVIYAMGYERNELPLINDTTPIPTSESGMIAPRLFGVGFAFPEKITYPNGDEGNCIGLDCFIDYAQKMVPEWVTSDMPSPQKRNCMKSHLSQLQQNSDLFKITIL